MAEPDKQELQSWVSAAVLQTFGVLVDKLRWHGPTTFSFDYGDTHVDYPKLHLLRERLNTPIIMVNWRTNHFEITVTL